MAYTPWDTYVDTVPVPTTIEELQQALTLKYNTTWPEIANQITSLGGDPTNFDELADLCGLGSIKSADGKSTMWYYKDSLDDFSYTPISSVSTNTYTSRSTVQTPMNTTIDDVTGKVTVSNAPKSGSFTQDAIYLFGEVGQAVGATATGISLGKEIDARLYNANPDFWDSIGMSSLNPETWATITNGDTSLGSTLFNFVFGIDANSGKAQAYMDAEAYAYMAYWMKTQGVFSEGSTIDGSDIGLPSDLIGWRSQFSITDSSPYAYGNYYHIYATPYFFPMQMSDQPTLYTRCIVTDRQSYMGKGIAVGYTKDTEATTTGTLVIASDTPMTICLGRVGENPFYWGISSEVSVGIPYTYDSKTVYYYNFGYSWLNGTPCNIITNANREKFAWALIYGDMNEAVEGIGTQEGATLPDTSSWTDIPSTDSYLRSAYPDLYSDALQYDALQPDGTVLTKTYIPVPMPDNITSPDTQHINTPWNNQQPTSDNASQTSTEIDIATSPDEFIKQLIKTITQTVQTTDTINPPTTGTGESPTPVPITGSASALWSVYHPSQAQVNSFGAWLWTDNIITQIQQVLQNPMDGIITLHKVFAMPVDSGTGTIVIGRLDSQVGTALVAQQYVTVDCGYIDCSEEFGNVFDYEPYTSLHLYLPFIGIVPLNVNEVMRSTLHVVYGVDVFTGACLATVEVARDGNAVNLYQYSGIASVEYPLTGATHSGLLAGLAGIVGTIAMGAVTGGVGLVGAGAIANGAIQAATSKNAHASNFSGNAGAMGIKKPYLIIERPITKVADTFPRLDGYPTNYSIRLGDCANHVVCKTAHVHGINATQPELEKIENYLLSGVEI